MFIVIRSARVGAARGRGRGRVAAARLRAGGLQLVLLGALLSGCAAADNGVGAVVGGGVGGTDPAAGSGPGSAAGSVAGSGAGAGPAASAAPGRRTPTPSPAPTAVIDVARQPTAPESQPGPVSAPVRVEVADLGIDMPVEAVDTADDSAMDLPANPAVAAWYRYGPGPDSPAGATVVAAHVDSRVYDIGPFAQLADAPAGTQIVLYTADGATHRYAVATVDTVLKPEVPWNSVFDRTGAPRLTLVTCGGEFDYEARRYLSNVIVTAVPVP